MDRVWSYGLLSFTNAIISPQNNKQYCVEVHAVISQYVFDNIFWLKKLPIYHHVVDYSLD